MSWRTSGGQFDANVPDYQKMLQSGHASSGSGWSSSTQSPYTSYSTHHSGGSLLNNRGRHGELHSPVSSQRSGSHGSYVPYQPHKYGLASESSYASTSTLASDLRSLDLDNHYRLQDTAERNGLDRGYSFDRKEYNLPGYRDTGLRMTNYSSDSGLNFGSNNRRSSEFDLERPAFRPDSPSRISDDFYTSPVKSSHSVSKYLQHNSDKIDTSISSQDQIPVRDSHEDTLESQFMSPPMYTGDREKLARGGLNLSSITKTPGDLTQWQKQQKTHLGHENGDPQVTYGRKLNGIDGYRTDMVSPPQRDNHSNHMENIRSVADAIIRDKDDIIEKMKMQIMALEESNRDMESKLKRTLMNGNHSVPHEAEAYSKLQDMEYRNSELRKEIAEVKLQKEAEVENMEIKLGAAEHEIDQLKAALKRCQPNNIQLQEKLKGKDEEIAEWKNKFTGLKNNNITLKQNLERLERYMSDLPTQEEFSKNTEELAVLQEEATLKTEQIHDLEERLGETTQLLSERETTILELEGKQQRLAEKMADLTREIQYIKSEGEGAALREAQEQLLEVTESRDKLLSDLEKAKKLLQDNHRGMTQMKVKHQNEVRQLKERLEQEEQSVIALRGEVGLKEEQIRKLNKSRREYADKNQDLESQTLHLQEQIKQYEQANTDDNQKLQRRFITEMGVCFSELQSLVQVCVERSEGKAPNMSLLLGMRGMEEEGAAGGKKREEKTLKQWLTKLKELRNDLEKVRKMICDKYAEEMGDNLNCATQ